MRSGLLLFFYILCLSARAGTEVFEPIQPVPPAPPIQSSPRAILGRQLFNDPRLSRNQTIACATCHDLNRGGMDNRPVAIGIDGTKGERNAPTILNSALNFRQFWDGRAHTLEDQIDGPVGNPREMDTNWPDLVARLREVPEYRASFAELFADGLTPGNVKIALAEFERTLNTPDSRFDLYLRGDSGAINAREKEGYQKFKTYGCASCHQGVNVGGNMFQAMGVMADYFKQKGKKPSEADLGRYLVTKKEEDRHVFRVPPLRNVELTAPYFHDGSARTLEEAIRVMAKYQLGRPIPKKDVDSIAAFLRTLTGKNPAAESR